ncbi:MAG: hypothetical protein KAR20_20130, partial [Candidatus Heimdallarchaeota archaeon]|nr:hypothetical protein [Candidatus Heimdallarchaeota archaeon]
CDEDDDGTVCCLIDGCNKRFEDYDEYLNHFLYNSPHTAFMKRNLMRYNFDEKEIEKSVFDPIEKKDIEHLIATDPNYAALKKKIDATYILEDKINFAVKHNRSLNFEITGIQGAGKSYAGIAIGYIIAGKWAEKLKKQTELNLEFELPQILELIKLHHRGDVLIQDEDPRGFGDGVRTNEEAFENLIKTLRKLGISLIIISPYETNVKVHFKIEFISYVSKTRVATGILFTRKGLALGYVYIKILDNVDYLNYEKKKDAFIEKMQLSSGFGVDNYDEDRIKRDVEKLRKVIYDIDPEMKKGEISVESGIIVKGNGRYQKLVANRVYRLLKNGTREEPAGEGFVGDRKLSWKHLKTINDKEIGKLIYKHSQPENPIQELGKEWWMEYYCTEGVTMKSCETYMNENHSALIRKATTSGKKSLSGTYFDGKVLQEFTENQNTWGNAVEKAVQEMYYPKHRIVGGTGKPDLVGKIDFIEVKGRPKVDKSRSI